MKKISVIMFAVILAVSVSAQKVIVRPVGPRVVYYHPYYHPYFWHPYYGLNYSWYYGRPAYYYYHQTKLEKQIQNIEDDYNDRISSVRTDDSLTGHERREKIRELRHERDQAVDDTRKNYYKQYEN